MPRNQKKQWERENQLKYLSATIIFHSSIRCLCSFFRSFIGQMQDPCMLPLTLPSQQSDMLLSNVFFVQLSFKLAFLLAAFPQFRTVTPLVCAVTPQTQGCWLLRGM